MDVPSLYRFRLHCNCGILSLHLYMFALTALPRCSLQLLSGFRGVRWKIVPSEDCSSLVDPALLCLLLLPISWEITRASQTVTIASQTMNPGGGGDYFPYILLRPLGTLLRSTVLRRKKNMAVQDGTVSQYWYLLEIRKFIDFISLFSHSVWFSFSFKRIFLCRFWNMQHIAA